MICSISLTNGFLLTVMYVKAIFSYVWVMELPPFYGKGYQLCLLPGLFMANYSVAYEETQANRVSDYRDFVWSLFPKVFLFDFFCAITVLAFFV